jgi:lauroyl/myristoyl acyltransferase
MGMFALAGANFGADRWRKTVSIDDATAERFNSLQSPRQPRPVLMLIPHTTLLEALTVIPLLLPQARTTNVLYRAFGSVAIERAVKSEREAHGARLLSRSNGVLELIRGLKRGENAAMLFDQNSGRGGGLISFMGRLAAATDLPDIIARQVEVEPVMVTVVRTGFGAGIYF